VPVGPRDSTRDDCAEASPLGLPGSDEVYNNYVRVPASSRLPFHSRCLSSANIERFLSIQNSEK